MRTLLVAFSIAIGFATPVFAQVDDEAMEAQRCIWRCGSFTGMRQPAYDQCIRRDCDVGPKPGNKGAKSKKRPRRLR